MAALGYAAYRQSPYFFRQYLRELYVPIASSPHLPNPADWPDKGVHAAWLGHSTVLIKLEGVTILTDPVFSERAGINLGLITVGVKRLVHAAIAVEELPPIDLILLSHAHMDHLDKPSLRALENKHTQIVTASHTADLMRARRFGKVTELGWGETVQAGEAKVRAFEVNHWGARVRTDTYRGYNGYTVEVRNRRILFGGDTAMTDRFRDARHRNGIDLAILPIGAYNPWIRVHCNPEQAWRMGELANSEFMLPVHHQTFLLGREPRAEPINRFVDAAGSKPERVALTNIGQEFHLS
jgi:L-ascorbate metabolism protein UlaG (beta-lactamase superfamily)